TSLLRTSGLPGLYWPGSRKRTSPLTSDRATLSSCGVLWMWMFVSATVRVTVTVKLAAPGRSDGDELPLWSVALQMTTVPPTGNFDPEGGEQESAGPGSTTSVTVTPGSPGFGTFAKNVPLVPTVMPSASVVVNDSPPARLAGMCTTGAVVSTTFTWNDDAAD